METAPSVALNVKNRSADTAVAWLKSGFNLYKSNFTLLIVTTLICFIVSFCSFALLAGPMSAGLYLILLRLTKEEEGIKPGISDVFSGFGYFVETLIFGVICLAANLIASWFFGKIPWVGGILSLAFQFGLGAVAMFGILLIVDKKQQPMAAFNTGIQAVKDNPGLMLFFTFLAGLVGASGLILLFVGIILTMPICIASVTIAYRDITSEQSSVEVTSSDENPVEASGS